MDIYSEVTSRIIAEMEKGIIPWEKPWIASGNCVSHATGKAYGLLLPFVTLVCSSRLFLSQPCDYIIL